MDGFCQHYASQLLSALAFLHEQGMIHGAVSPSNVLFAQDLPDDCNDMMLSILFQQYGGFKEVRMVPGKKGIAFVEFADETQASLALQGLDNFKLTPTDTLALSFAKR